jgi:ligand-binding sensor domain-containing protein
MSLRFAVFVLAAISVRPAMGLDPSRTLTQYAHRIWQAQQGLPQGTIYSILQTHEGYLWLGTQTGLIRFDGVRFEALENIRRSAPSNVWVRNAIEDSHHALWLATVDSGLYRLEGDSLNRYLGKDNVQCVAEARNGDIWACTSNGVARIAAGQLTMFSTEQGLADKNVYAACQANDGTLWVRCIDSLAAVFRRQHLGRLNRGTGSDR